MKAISIKQPWASMIISGRKTIELRTWDTNYRGPLLICASKSGNWRDGLPRGMAIGIVDLVDIVDSLPGHAAAACVDRLEAGELWCWLLGNARAIPPFPVKGRLNLYDVELPSRA